MNDIGEWWPKLDEEIRRWMVNNYWSAVAAYSLGEIARVGGPADGDPFWELRGGEYYLPHDAVMWVIGCPDFERLNMPKGPDPRAAYFRRGWPRRQD